MHPDLISCRNCSHVVNDNFCSHCGQPVHVKRVDAHYILHEIQHILHFEKGIFFTVKELLIRPGQNIRTFITENRSRLVKPVIFIIVSSLIYTIISHFFRIEEGYVEFTEVKNKRRFNFRLGTGALWLCQYFNGCLHFLVVKTVF